MNECSEFLQKKDLINEWMNVCMEESVCKF
jgi:hypothetical protein